MQLIPRTPDKKPGPLVRSRPVVCQLGLTAAAIVAFGAVVAMLAGGCGPASTPATRPASDSDRPFAGVALTVTCPADNPAFADEFRNLAANWAAENGATVNITTDAPENGTGVDAVVVPTVDVGQYAAFGKAASLSPAIRRGGPPAEWDRVLPLYRKELAGWGGAEVGLPLAGDGYVLVYRADLLTDPVHLKGVADRSPVTELPPRSWEDVAVAAAYFADATGKPSLPPWPTDNGPLLTRFHQIAACYDRSASSRGQVDAKGPDRDTAALSFHFDLDTGRPRLTTPGFIAALDWLARSNQYRPPTPGDPVDALTSGSAVMAVLSLRDLARLPRDGGPVGPVSAKFGLAPLPGTEEAFGPDGRKVRATGLVNYVPYLGSGGLVGIVLADGKNQAAAWDLLGTAAGPSGSRALMTDPTAGVGPFRTEHVYEPSCWLGYGFDADRTRMLTDAMQRYVGVEVSNPALAVRTPGQAELMAALGTQVRAAATGERPPAEALRQAEAEWGKLTAGVPAAELRTWRRNAAGVQ